MGWLCMLCLWKHVLMNNSVIDVYYFQHSLALTKIASKSCIQCAKDDFPHAQYAVYLHAIGTRRAVKCGIAAVTWYDVTANHCRAAHSIPHFTFRIPHATVPHFTHSQQKSMRSLEIDSGVLISWTPATLLVVVTTPMLRMWFPIYFAILIFLSSAFDYHIFIASLRATCYAVLMTGVKDRPLLLV